MSTPSSNTPISPLAGLDVMILAVSTNAILVRWSATPSFVKTFYRVLFAIALLALVALVRHHDVLTTISGRDLLAAGGAGVALATHSASQFKSLNHATIAASVTLVQSQSFFVTVGIWAVLNGYMDRRTTVGIGVVFADMALMSVPDLLAASDASQSLLGNGLATIGTVTATVCVLADRSARSRVSLAPYVVIVYPARAIALLVAAVDHGDPLTGHPPREWLLSLGIAIGPGVFDHAITNWTLAYLESSAIPASLLDEPIGGMILVLFLLSEISTLPTVLSGVVVPDGIYVGAP